MCYTEFHRRARRKHASPCAAAGLPSCAKCVHASPQIELMMPLSVLTSPYPRSAAGQASSGTRTGRFAYRAPRAATSMPCTPCHDRQAMKHDHVSRNSARYARTLRAVAPVFPGSHAGNAAQNSADNARKNRGPGRGGAVCIKIARITQRHGEAFCADRRCSASRPACRGPRATIAPSPLTRKNGAFAPAHGARPRRMCFAT